MPTDSFYTYRDADGRMYVKTDINNGRKQCKNDFFKKLSETIWYASKNGEKVLDIYYAGFKVRYDGWMPRVGFVYSIDGKVIWKGKFY